MGWFSRGQKPAKPFIYGKVPRVPDFVRGGDGGGQALRTVEWVERSLSAAQSRADGIFQASFDRGVAARCLFVPAEVGEATAVLLSPSRDAVGRSFPLLVQCQTPKQLADAPELGPLACEEFFRQGETALSQALQMRAGSELESLLPQLTPPLPEAIELAGARYASFCTSTPVSALASLSEPWTRDQWSYAFAYVAQALEPVIGRERPPTRLGLRLPLGQWRSFGATFWCDVIKRIMRWRSTVAAAIWSEAVPGATLVLYPGGTQDNAFEDHWAPNPSNGTLCDLTSQAPAPVSVSAELSRVLSNPDARLSDLLATL